MRFILKPNEINSENKKLLGGKGSHLAEMINAGFPVPEAFFITTDAFFYFLDKNGLKWKIREIISKINFSNVQSLEEASQAIKAIIIGAHIPEEMEKEIIESYKKLETGPETSIDFLKAGRELPFVAARSSSVLEDIAKTSSAGQQETYLNVRGNEELLESVKKCWASLYTPRAIYYRHKHNQPQDTGICVIIQRMINSYSSGVSFTVDPTKPVEGKDHIVTEACWGLGETIVQGEVNPDRYVVDKRTGTILEKKIGIKKIMRVKDPVSGKTVKREVPFDKINTQILTDSQIVELSAYCKKIENYYNGKPQDIEWATEKGKIYILQTRDVTVLEQKTEEKKEVTVPPLLKGLGASPGLAKGKVKLIASLSELNKIQKGDVLVTTMTNPDMVPAMEKAAAIVTNEGGMTCHAAIVSRELGIPCIVATGNATQILKDDQEIVVDATRGYVYPAESGTMPMEFPIMLPLVPAEISEQKVFSAGIVTATDIKANIAFPETAERGANADGVGLMRLEHMLTKAGMHPAQYIREGRSEELTNIIVENVGKVAKVFYPKQVWVRTLDIRTDEYKNMLGGDLEPKEDNPMLGWHGIRRDLDEPELFKAQLRAFKILHEQGLTNVLIMLPFVIDVSELKKAKELAKEIRLPDTAKFGVMIETPAAALTIEEFCKEGISFISFGSNDLTQLTLGLDRNNALLAKLFNEEHNSMKFLFKHVINTCKKYGVQTSICGEAPSNRFDIVDFLVRCGIDSLSVNLDAIDKVRAWVSKIEQRILLEKK